MIPTFDMMPVVQIEEAEKINEAQVIFDLISKYFGLNFKYDAQWSNQGRLKSDVYEMVDSDIPDNLHDYNTLVSNLDSLRKDIKKLDFVKKYQCSPLLKNERKDVIGYILTVASTKQNNRFDFEIVCKDKVGRFLGDKSDEVHLIHFRIFANDDLKKIARDNFK